MVANESHHTNKGLYIAILRKDDGDYPNAFHYKGDEHESAWGWAKRTELFNHPIVTVIPAHKFGGSRVVKLFETKAVNRGCRL